MSLPRGRCELRRLLNLCSSQVSHEKKQQGIHRNVQVEIDKAMHEKAAAGYQTGELQSPGKKLLSWRKRFSDSASKAPMNQAQQRPPAMPVSARASR
jgi:hypothetical protein